MNEIKQVQDTRREFIDTIHELATKDQSVVLIVPDVGFNYIEKFQNAYPERYFNFGVTEATTTIIAAALALEGFKPYVYSMINFVVFRPYEMVRNAIVHHKANVKLIGVKGSEKYKFLGFSHNLEHEKEDLVACENIGLEWHTPRSNDEVRKAIIDTYHDEKAAYIRI